LNGNGAAPDEPERRDQAGPDKEPGDSEVWVADAADLPEIEKRFSG